MTAIPAGAVVLFLDGELYDAPSRFSVQVGVARHVDAPRDLAEAAAADRYLWRNLNHSCCPNTVLHERALVAARPIAAGEEVCFDYEANEWQMASPFACGCGAPRCRWRVRGYRFLSAAGRRAVARFASAHVLALAAES